MCHFCHDARTLSLASRASARETAASSSVALVADGADAVDADADADNDDAASSAAAWRSAIFLSRALSFFRD